MDYNGNRSIFGKSILKKKKSIKKYRFKLNSTKQWIAINYLSIANRSRKKKNRQNIRHTPFFKIIPRRNNERQKVSWPSLPNGKLQLEIWHWVALIWRISPLPVMQFPPALWKLSI